MLSTGQDSTHVERKGRSGFTFHARGQLTSIDAHLVDYLDDVDSVWWVNMAPMLTCQVLYGR